MEKQAKSTAVSTANVTESPEQVPAVQPPLKDRLQIVQNALAIVGMVGTLFVWGAANFYVGDVEVVPNHDCQNISVQVFDRKGEETDFHSKKFQLMPGSYHIEVTADGSPKVPADIQVEFGHKQQVLIALAQSTNSSGPSQPKAAAENEQGIPAPADTKTEALPGPPLPQQAASSPALPKHKEAQATQISEDTQSEETQAQRNEHHHWWQFRHKKVD